MKKVKLGLLLLLLAFATGCSDRKKDSKNAIVIDATISEYFYRQLQGIFTLKSDIRIQYTPLHYMSSVPSFIVASGKLEDRKARWVLFSDEPIIVSPPFGSSIILNPGDSLHIKYQGENPIYSGTNIKSMELLTALMQANEKLIKPRKKNSYNATSIADFTEWNQYIDNKLSMQIEIIESYKEKIPANDYAYYKAHAVNKLEYDRINAFTALSDSVQSGYPGLSSFNLKTIWDSTEYKPWAKWLRSLSTYYGSIEEIYDFNRMEVWRKFNFDFKHDSLHFKENRPYLYYANAKQKFQGLLRERLLTFILDEQTITELGINNNIAQLMLKDYYNQPGFPEYKKWVKQLEEKAQ